MSGTGFFIYYGRYGVNCRPRDFLLLMHDSVILHVRTSWLASKERAHRLTRLLGFM